jgi:hypothetical protein
MQKMRKKENQMSQALNLENMNLQKALGFHKNSFNKAVEK